jgi:hypothetical protein
MGLNHGELAVALGVGRSTLSFEVSGDTPNPAPCVVHALEDLGIDGGQYQRDFWTWYVAKRAWLTRRVREALRGEGNHAEENQ